MLQATRGYIEGLTAGLSGKTGIKFIPGTTWRADAKNKKLEFDMQGLKGMPFLTAKGLIIHETGHLKYTTQSGPDSLEHKYPAMHEVYNHFEDLRMEAKIIDDYGDFASESLAAILSHAMPNIAKNLPMASKFDQFIMGSHLAISYYHDETWDKLNDNTRYSIRDTLRSLDTEVIKRRDEIDWRSFYDDIRSCKNTAELCQLVDEKIYPLIKDWIPDTPPPPQGIAEKSRSAGMTPENPMPADIPSNIELEQLLRPYIDTLSIKIKNILKEKQATRYTGTYKRGKLLSKNAYKVLTDDTRIFCRKNNPNRPHYCITFILDESGSMKRENKYVGAFMGSFLIDKVCQKLGFKINYIKYNGDIKTMAGLDGYRDFRGGGNDDLLAMSEAEKLIDYGDDNIIFILTDGSVCNDPTPAIKRLESHNVPIVAVGVGLNEANTQELAKYYPHPISVPDVTQLPNVLINCLAKLIHR